MRIEPPGYANDLDEAGRDAWSAMMSGMINRLIDSRHLTQFFNPLKSPPKPDAVEKKISWTAFPKSLSSTGISDVKRWRIADERRFDWQDEYCEWHVERGPDNKVVRVTFTSEGPEYWGFLAEHAPDTLLRLYRKFAGPAVQMEDLLVDGQYNSQNRWNDPGQGGKAIHLGHRNNTLGAFVDIGGRATIIRARPDGSPMTGEQELIECGRYGGANRHSDPHIGGEVNALARMGARITMANPVGLSMDGLFPSGWVTPDGSDPKSYWRVIRGTEEHQLRAVYEVPADRGFVVGDIKINDQPIKYGGQIADFIQVKLVGLADGFGKHLSPSRQCEGQVQVAIADEESVMSDWRA